VYAYKNWFSTKEKETLEPFLIQSEYTDESFTATDDVDVKNASDPQTYVATSQGTMTIEEYNNATSGYYAEYVCAGDTVNYKATPYVINEQ